MLDNKVIERGEQFKNLSKDILPLVRKIEGVLEKHGVSCMASLTVDVSSGYFVFNTHGTDWEMGRSDSGCPVKLRHSYSEELTLEEEKTFPEGQETAIRAYINYGKEA